MRRKGGKREEKKKVMMFVIEGSTAERLGNRGLQHAAVRVLKKYVVRRLTIHQNLSCTMIGDRRREKTRSRLRLNDFFDRFRSDCGGGDDVLGGGLSGLYSTLGGGVRLSYCESASMYVFVVLCVIGRGENQQEN